MTVVVEVLYLVSHKGDNMKRFTQFLGVRQGEKRFKQAPNAVLIQNVSDGNLWSPILNPVVQGSISSSTGGESDSNSRLRTQGYIKVEPNTTYEFNSNLARIFVIEYSDTTSKPIASSGWKNVPFTYKTNANANYIRMTLANESNSSIKVTDFEWLRIKKA